MPLKVLILGHGEMGHAMEYLLQDHHQLDIWEKFPQSTYPHAVLEESVCRMQISYCSACQLIRIMKLSSKSHH
ncbi:hypothetical protein [Nitrosomonas sp. Nm166]|uniref:hypothetical protein n=1 Tax=Nitrosomonas sp. Nm166 TaxID=1881054 RepID=UPI0015A6C290|nr:hypothetical protein [Nitrosomonas sp. Nm166]